MGKGENAGVFFFTKEVRVDRLFHVCFYTVNHNLFNSLPESKVMDWSKFYAFADNKINVIENMKSVLERVENIVGKGENASYQHFLLL